jgi:hypothetical protein
VLCQVITTVTSHGRVALVLETLVRGIWEQTDKNTDSGEDESATHHE